MAHRIRPARWTSKRPVARRFRIGGYRAPAPDPDVEGELDFHHHGEYMALRDGWLRRMVRRLARKIRGVARP